MFRMIRTLLIWLLTLALPVQAVMAATMVFCGPNHHDGAFATTTSHDAAAANQQHETAAQSGGAVVNGQVDNTATDEAAAPDKFAQSDMQKCSVCASCCSAAAIHDTVPKLPALEPVAADFAALASAVEPFAAGGPDRPPRQFLA